MGKRRFASSCMAEGLKTAAERFGSNHVSSHTRGWDEGIYVHARVDPVTGKDLFEIWITGGSNNPTPKKLIATLAERRVTYGV